MTVWTLPDGDTTVAVHDGPALLAGLAAGPSLAAHEEHHGPLPGLGADDLVGLAEAVRLHGRGGAAFPFARKVATAWRSPGRAVVVVNLGEGEPASHKDAVLAQVAPHLVLDGASVTARALGASEVHLVVPSDRPAVGHAVRLALAERRSARRIGRSAPTRDGRLRWTLHRAGDHFVAGQSAAVLELVAGRANLPVTTWRPSAVAGHRGRPTVLSNGETFAHVGLLALHGPTRLRRHGTVDEPGTTLLTLDGDTPSPTVLEVPFGTPWSRVLPPERVAAPVLLGGYHGVWVAPGALRGLTVSTAALRPHGLGLGAGVVLPLDAGCPVVRTSEIVRYLAAQSARRCGPCLNGLPSLAAAVEAVRSGTGGVEEVERLGSLVDGRGACAHPDGTVRLVRSLLGVFGGELAVHAQGGCGLGGGVRSTLGEVSA